MPRYYLCIENPLNLMEWKVGDSYKKQYKGKELLAAEGISVRELINGSHDIAWEKSKVEDAERDGVNLVIFSFESYDKEFDLFTTILSVIINGLKYFRLGKKYDEVNFDFRAAYVDDDITYKLTKEAAASVPELASATSAPAPSESAPAPAIEEKSIYNPTSDIKKYLCEVKKLTLKTINDYVNGLIELPQDVGIIRTVHFLQWLIKQNISDAERHLINYILLTHEYTSLRVMPNFLGSLVVGTLREAAWKEYQAWHGLVSMGLNDLSEYFYKNELKFIIETYARNSIKEDIAKKNLEAFRSRVGGLLDIPGFNPEDEPITQEDIQALVKGELLLPSQLQKMQFGGRIKL